MCCVGCMPTRDVDALLAAIDLDLQLARGTSPALSESCDGEQATCIPAEAVVCVAHAKTLLDTTDWRGALEFAQDTLQRRWPHMPQGYLVAGHAASKLSRHAIASQNFATCLELLPDTGGGSEFPARCEVSALLRGARNAEKLVECRATQLQPSPRGARRVLAAGAAVLSWRVPVWLVMVVWIGTLVV